MERVDGKNENDVMKAMKTIANCGISGPMSDVVPMMNENALPKNDSIVVDVEARSRPMSSQRRQ